MSTKLDKTIKREIAINGEAYTITITPAGVKVTRKGSRLGLDYTWVQLSDGRFGNIPR